MNILKLKGRIVEKGTTIPELSQAIGMDKATLYRRLANDGNDFTLSEIIGIKTALDLDISEVESIFFS